MMNIELKETGWPLIELGYGKVEVAEGTQEDKPALIFGRNGTGKIGEATPPNRHATHEETLAVVTFANVESLDVVMGKLQVLRDKMAAPRAAADTGEQEAFEKWAVERGGFAERMADGSYRDHRLAAWWFAWQARAALSQQAKEQEPVRVEQIDAERTVTTYKLCTCGDIDFSKLPPYARDRDGQRVYGAGYIAGRKKGRSETAPPQAEAQSKEGEAE